jgi:hypothetical protein
MQQALLKYNKLGHVYVKEDMNDGRAHLITTMTKYAP